MQALQLAAFLSIGLASLGAALSGWLYYDLYWRWRPHFDADGRYFDERTMVVHHQQNEALLAPLLGCLAWLAASRWFAFKHKQKPD